MGASIIRPLSLTLPAGGPSLADTPLPDAPLWQRLMAVAVLAPEDWDDLAPADRARVEAEKNESRQLDLLVAVKLLTDYQAGRIRAGRRRGLVLGNYRVLDRIGSGGMGVVYRGEHRRLRQPVAIKALQAVADAATRGPSAGSSSRCGPSPSSSTRTSSPPSTPARSRRPGPDGPAVPYFVMEYVPGKDLEQAVAQNGPLPVAPACHVAHQIADALLEAHRLGLVHRDIKPSQRAASPRTGRRSCSTSAWPGCRPRSG